MLQDNICTVKYTEKKRARKTAGTRTSLVITMVRLKSFKLLNVKICWPSKLIYDDGFNGIMLTEGCQWKTLCDAINKDIKSFAVLSEDAKFRKMKKKNQGKSANQNLPRKWPSKRAWEHMCVHIKICRKTAHMTHCTRSDHCITHNTSL